VDKGSYDITLAYPELSLWRREETGAPSHCGHLFFGAERLHIDDQQRGHFAFTRQIVAGAIELAEIAGLLKTGSQSIEGT
jgi:hypothetical protein